MIYILAFLKISYNESHLSFQIIFKMWLKKYDNKASMVKVLKIIKMRLTKTPES